MSNISALNRAILAGQRLQAVTDAARVVAAETRVFKLGDYYVDLPAGYELAKHEA